MGLLMFSFTSSVFLHEITAHIEQHLSDSNLNVEELTDLLGMSRTDLHRKLDRTVGMSTTEYMRYLRLQHAAELLLAKPDWPVGQVAMEVGFNSQSYFSRRFRELFGISAKDWRQRNMRAGDRT